jgi:hypothetical protein
MTTTELVTPPQAPEPTAGETLDETLPLVGAVPVYGPPVVFLVGPWLLLALMLAGPFALLVTFVVLFAAAAALVGLIGAILAAPYLLVRHLRGYRTSHTSMRAPAPRLVAAGSR